MFHLLTQHQDALAIVCLCPAPLGQTFVNGLVLFQCGDQVPGIIEPFEEARSREWLAQDACIPNKADPVPGIGGKIYNVDQLSVGALSL